MPDDTASNGKGHAYYEDRINGRHCPRNLAEEMVAAVENAKKAKATHVLILQFCLRYYQAVEAPHPEAEANFAASPWQPSRFGCATNGRWQGLKKAMLSDLERKNIKGFKFND